LYNIIKIKLGNTNGSIKVAKKYFLYFILYNDNIIDIGIHINKLNKITKKEIINVLKKYFSAILIHSIFILLDRSIFILINNIKKGIIIINIKNIFNMFIKIFIIVLDY
jgi:hypothetical protein